MKLNPLRENIAGKRLVVVDDSIVRGTTTRAMVQMLREAGAAEVHLRISSPPYRWPCFYGMDTGTRGELLAANLTVDEIRDYLGVDTLAYLSLDRLVARHRRGRRRVLRRLPHRRRTRSRSRSSLSKGVLESGGEVQRDRRRVARPAARRRPSPARRRPARERASKPSDGRDATRPPASTSTRARQAVEPHQGPAVRSTFRPEVIGDIGGFGGLFAFDTSRYRTAGPRLVHRRRRHQGAGRRRPRGRFDTIGIDLVAMCVDDLVCQGAEPLFFLDYIAVGAPRPRPRSSSSSRGGRGLPAGAAARWSAARWPSTPGPWSPASSTSSASRSASSSATASSPATRPGPATCYRPAVARPALQRLLAGPPGPVRGRPALDAPATRAPTTWRRAARRRSSTRRPSSPARRGRRARHRPHHRRRHPRQPGPGAARPVVVRLDRSTWEAPPIFGEIQRLGGVSDEEMAKVFNLGIGMVVVVRPEDGDRTVDAAPGVGPRTPGRSAR